MTPTRSIYTFLAGTFGLAFIAFAGMLFVPGAQSPEGWPGLPIWLLAIWSPSVTAMIMAYRQGKLKNLLKRLVAFRAAGPASTIMLTPILVLAVFVILSGQAPDLSAVSPLLLVGLLGLNLVLGPLGEELGWRGFLLPALEIRMGWLGAAIVVGAIWIVWHAPLWLFDSPQSAIPFWAFASHAMLYSILMAAAHRLAPTSLVPAVVLHLLFNVTVALAIMWNVANIVSFYTISLPIYALATIVISGLLSGKAGCPLPRST